MPRRFDPTSIKTFGQLTAELKRLQKAKKPIPEELFLVPGYSGLHAICCAHVWDGLDAVGVELLARRLECHRPAIAREELNRAPLPEVLELAKKLIQARGELVNAFRLGTGKWAEVREADLRVIRGTKPLVCPRALPKFPEEKLCKYAALAQRLNELPADMTLLWVGSQETPETACMWHEGCSCFSGDAFPGQEELKKKRQPATPRWDAERRELQFGGWRKSYVRKKAEYQELILASFEELKWPLRVDSPLPARVPLKETLRNLNKSLGSKAPLRFGGDGTAAGIRWREV